MEQLKTYTADEFSTVYLEGQVFPVLAQETIHPSLIREHFTLTITHEMFGVDYLIGTIPKGRAVPMVIATILSGFDAGIIHIGDLSDESRLFPAENIRMGMASTYQCFPHVTMIEDTNIFLFTGGAPTQGNGIITVYLA